MKKAPPRNNAIKANSVTSEIDAAGFHWMVVPHIPLLMPGM